MIGALALLGLALLDALNPFTIAAMVVLVGTDRPAARGLVFISGTFAAYLLGGFLLLQGWMVLAARLLPLLPGWALPGLEVGAGLLCLLAAAYVRAQARGGRNVAAPSALSLPAVAAFALVSTLSDLPTAVPYFAAIGRLPELAATLPGRIGWLVIYNLLYVSPLLAVLAVRLGIGDRGRSLLERIQALVDRAFAMLLPPLLLAGGLLLALDGARRLLEL